MKKMHKKVNKNRTSFIFIFVFIVLVSLTFGIVKAGYYCGGGPCTVNYTCNGGLSCGAGNKCGTYYNQCVGSICNSNSGFDTSTCNTANQCTPGGTTRTSSWSGWSACSGGTQSNTCSCGSQNNCSVSCHNPEASCGTVLTQKCGPGNLHFHQMRLSGIKIN